MRITIDPSGRGKRNRPSIFAPEIEARNFHVVPLSRVFGKIRRFVESKVHASRLRIRRRWLLANTLIRNWNNIIL